MLSRKNSRPILFNDQPYRWSVAHDGEYTSLAVQHSSNDGQKLEIIIRSIEWQQDTGDGNIRPITPALVSSLMAGAIDCGWEPASRHPPLELSLDDDDQLVVRRGVPNIGSRSQGA